jgi:phosphoglycerate dehydrogenase-like enzyme
MPSELTIWCNARFPESETAELEAGVRPHRLLRLDENASNLTAGGPSELLAEADVAFGQPDPDQVKSLANLRWVHLTSAGYTRYDRADMRVSLAARGAALTTSSSVYDEPCAQHLLAFMLAQARRLPASLADQLALRSWDYERIRPTTRLLGHQTTLILGYGAIARRLIELLAPFHMNLMAVRQHVRGDEAIPVYPIGKLIDLLPTADHVVNCLPASSSTDRLMGSAQFLAMKRGAQFYNIGRGTTVDQPSLIAALESSTIAGAYLDVTEPEPLPSDDPLWTTPNCYITPHIGGGYDDEALGVVHHFLANLRRFEANEPLLDQVI